MTLPQPIAVAAAITGGAPTDVREWIVVDIVGAPSPNRRGYAVIVEPLVHDGRTLELVPQIRDVLLHQLRLHAQFRPDMALLRAFAHANSVLLDEKRLVPGSRVQIGATAIVFEDHQATIGHLPPGQLVLIQDRLIYSLPSLDSYSPRFADSGEGGAEPLGFGSVTSPILVQTEMMPGDAVILCDSATARAIANADESQLIPIDHFHGRNPEDVLDAIRDDVVEAGEPFSAAVVIAFPPNEHASEIETLTDVARNAREQARHLRASTRALVPTVPDRWKRSRPQPESQDQQDDVPFAPPTVPKISFQERLIRLTEGRPTDAARTWQPRRPDAAFGAPGAHGVKRHKSISNVGAWRGKVPRAPFIGSPAFIALALVAVFLLGFLVWSQRGIFTPDETSWMPSLAQVEQRLSAVEGMTDHTDIIQELNLAQRDLDHAETIGAPGSAVDPLQIRITQARDEADNVIRVSNVRRIGNLPDELKDGNTDAFFTSGGIFLANGNLYRLHPETAQIAMMLEKGREIENIRVGDLFGVAYDGYILVVTDGRAIFFASNTDGAIWQAMEMEEINNQGPWPRGSIAAFNQNMYLLVPEYRNIYSWVTNANEQVVAPIDWISTGDRVNMNIAVDMAIDGNIYVLLSDGQVVTLRSGLETNRFDLPNFDLEEEQAVRIVTGPATGYLYMVVVNEDGGGRVIATDRRGENAVEIHLPIGYDVGDSGAMAPFAGLQDMVVDEQAGKMYLINGDAIWSLDYSLPPLPGGTDGTPEAVSETEDTVDTQGTPEPET